MISGMTVDDYEIVDNVLKEINYKTTGVVIFHVDEFGSGEQPVVRFSNWFILETSEERRFINILMRRVIEAKSYDLARRIVRLFELINIDFKVEQFCKDNKKSIETLEILALGVDK